MTVVGCLRAKYFQLEQSEISEEIALRTLYQSVASV